LGVARSREQQRNLGRYEGVGSALNPGGLRREGKHLPGRIEIAHARLVDPKAQLLAAHLQVGKFQQTMVNIARDPLEREYRYGRLDRLQHAAGSRYRGVLAWAAGRGDSGDGGLRSSAYDASEYKTIKMLDAASAAVAIRREAAQLCGPRGEMVLTCVLGDELSFRETADKIGSEPGAPRFWRAQAGASRVAEQFRGALRLLADDWFRATA
jgi:hypothetical protein